MGIPNLKQILALLFLVLPLLGVFGADFNSVSSLWTHLNTITADEVKLLASKQTWFVLLLCFGSGLLTSLTPCVYPIIPITINIFGRVANTQSSNKLGFQPKTFGVAIIYVGGMCFTYSLLGLVSGLTGSLFGNLLQSPILLASLTIVFFLLFLGQLGVFNISLPGTWQTKLASFGKGTSFFGIFTMGAVSGLIVSPCVGPVITGILTFVFESSNAFLGLLYFFSFSVGLGVLFLVLGGFSGILNYLPRSGSWTTRVNYLLATLLLIASGYYGYLLLKQSGIVETQRTVQSSPIHWMNNEQEAFAQSRQKKLPIIVDFTAEWCAACKEIDAGVFHDPVFLKSAENKFIPLRIDVTQNNEENSKILRKFGVVGLPTIVFVKSSGEIMDRPRIHGLITTEEFLEILNSVSNF